jgi:dipeptidase E
MRLLLFSNSTNAGEEYLSYTLPYIKEFLTENEKEAVFIPFAGISVGFDAYTHMVSGKLGSIGLRIKSLHQVRDKIKMIREASCIIIGGGNTFYLLKLLQDENLLDPIREEVKAGKPFIGWSAGSNVTCPTICTTNDMPIVEPADFTALDLIPFQINPHYTDVVLKQHAGETREMRINEYILANHHRFVAGLREGTLLEIKKDMIRLKGNKPCRIFHYGQETVEVSPGQDLGFLLK